MNKAVLLDDTVAAENYNLRVAVEEGTFCHRWATGFRGGMITDEVKGPHFSQRREKRGTQLKVGYGETVIVAWCANDIADCSGRGHGSARRKTGYYCDLACRYRRQARVARIPSRNTGDILGAVTRRCRRCRAKGEKVVAHRSAPRNST
jgi:hypothetical protein